MDKEDIRYRLETQGSAGSVHERNACLWLLDHLEHTYPEEKALLDDYLVMLDARLKTDAFEDSIEDRRNIWAKIKKKVTAHL